MITALTNATVYTQKHKKH